MSCWLGWLIMYFFVQIISFSSWHVFWHLYKSGEDNTLYKIMMQPCYLFYSDALCIKQDVRMWWVKKLNWELSSEKKPQWDKQQKDMCWYDFSKSNPWGKIEKWQKKLTKVRQQKKKTESLQFPNHRTQSLRSLQILIGKPRPVRLITADVITELSVSSDLSIW